jgi:hypothetical protein
VVFHQLRDGDDITIRVAPVGDDGPLETLRAADGSAPRRFAVIPLVRADGAEEILQAFKHLKVEGALDCYRPAPELIRHVERAALKWGPRPRKPRYDLEPKPKAPPLVDRVCEGCRLPYRTRASMKYCSKCQDAIRRGLEEEGYLRRVPKSAQSNPDNASATREIRGSADSNPWYENAVRALEE